MLTIAICIAYAISVASAQIVITRPTGDTIYTAGETGLITWHWPDAIQEIDVISVIELRRRINDDDDHIVIGAIAEQVDPTDGGYIWTVPADITPFGHHYDVVISSPSLPSSFASEGYFAIEAPIENATSSIEAMSPTSSNIVSTSTSSPSLETIPSPEETSLISSEKVDSTSGGVIAGAVVGSAVGIGLIVGAITLFFIRKRRQARNTYESESNGDFSDGKNTDHAADFIPPYFTESEQDSRDAVHSLSTYHTYEAPPKVVYATTSEKTEVPHPTGSSTKHSDDVPRYRMTPIS